MEKGENREDDGVVMGEEEEQKMEEFFALIRSFQEARNRRMSELEDGDRKKAKSRRLNEEKPSWVPSFEWQDFREDVCFRKTPLIFPDPCNNKTEKQQEDIEDEGLDLNLTL